MKEKTANNYSRLAYWVNSFSRFLFSIEVVQKKPLAQPQPTNCAVQCFLASALGLGCRLVVQTATSRTDTMLRNTPTLTTDPPPLYKAMLKPFDGFPYYGQIETESFSTLTLLPVLIFDTSTLSTKGISLIIAPTATMVSVSLFTMPAGATPFFFMRYSV